MYRQDQALRVTLLRTLESAKVAYEAYVQSSSRDTLKALADLRNTVIEETQKVTQRAQDMTAGLWRDLAITAAPFVLKVFGDGAKVTSIRVSATFYIAVAIFISLSFVLQWRINNVFLQSLEVSRRRWLQTLYQYISTQEREEIAETPIRQAVASYRETRGVLLIVYVVLVGVLISVGVYTLGTPLSAPSVIVNTPSNKPLTGPTGDSTTNPSDGSKGLAKTPSGPPVGSPPKL